MWHSGNSALEVKIPQKKCVFEWSKILSNDSKKSNIATGLIVNMCHKNFQSGGSE